MFLKPNQNKKNKNVSLKRTLERDVWTIPRVLSLLLWYLAAKISLSQTDAFW